MKHRRSRPCPIRQLHIPSGSLEYKHPDTQRLLHVENEFFSAIATFDRKDAIRRCIQADSSVVWLKQTPFDHIKIELLKRGCSWKHLPVRFGKDGTDPIPSLHCDGTPCNKLKGTNPGNGMTKARSGEPPSKTDPSVASLSLQTGAQLRGAACAALIAGLVATAGG